MDTILQIIAATTKNTTSSSSSDGGNIFAWIIFILFFNPVGWTILMLIWDAAHGVQKRAGGYGWIYKDEYESGKRIPIYKDKPNASVPRAIIQYKLDGKTVVARHESISEAARKSGVGYHSVHDAARGMQKTGGGYIWKFK